MTCELKTLEKALFDEMSSESDRGCILVGASVLEELLEDVIRLKLSPDKHVVKHAVEPLFSPMGPLSSFSAKIKAAYSLGLVKKWCFEDLEKVRKIRNVAAHSYASNSFANQDVSKITCQLTGADLAVKSFPDKPQHTGDKNTSQRKSTKGEEPPLHKERVRFIFTVNYIAGILHGFLEGVKEGLEILERHSTNHK